MADQRIYMKGPLQPGEAPNLPGGALPTYTPLLAWSAAGGTLNNAITGWDGSQTRLTYSEDVTGPFGGSMTAQQQVLSTDNYFGGTILDNLDLRSGDEVWMRIYHWFPSGFQFRYGTVSGDGYGSTKWYRFGLDNDTGRMTFQLGDLNAEVSGDGHGNFESGSGNQTGVCFVGFTDEYGGGTPNTLGTWGNGTSGDPGPAHTTNHLMGVGEWLAMQVHVYFHTTNGFARGWINDNYLGEYSGNTLGPRTALTEILFGDYWNGGPGVTQDFYIDEVIITDQEPNTQDSGGRSYIHPDTEVADFP